MKIEVVNSLVVISLVHIHFDIHTNIDRQTDRQTDRETDTDRQTDRQTDRCIIYYILYTNPRQISNTAVCFLLVSCLFV